MNINNLERAKEIAIDMPILNEARKMLSDQESRIQIVLHEKTVTIPQKLVYNVINVLNCEYERLREEVKKL